MDNLLARAAIVTLRVLDVSQAAIGAAFRDIITKSACEG
jgi:hypothetical protein